MMATAAKRIQSMVFLGVLASGACSLTTPLDELASGAGATPGHGGSGASADGGIKDVAGDQRTDTTSDVGCDPTTTKICNGLCVDRSDPTWGCAATSCSPCNATHAASSCVNGQCMIDKCDAGWGNCNGLSGDGCELGLSTNENCGTCGKPCSLAHAQSSCANATCVIVQCEAGWGDCDHDPTTGCEASLKTLANCGGCGAPCTVQPNPTCATGQCKVDSCSPGTADCDGDGTCETDLKTSQNCGACGLTCSFPQGTAACQSSQCTLTGCAASFANCDGVVANGCEVNIGADNQNCGSCGAACNTSHASDVGCSGNTCVHTCAEGYGDCDGPSPGAADNGCETQVTTTANCGICANACSSNNGSASCQGSMCTIACNAGWGDCDATTSNGCETPTQDISNCGSCGHNCAASNATPSCQAGACSFTCNYGYSDCDYDASNGCESNTGIDPVNCGTCGAPCLGGGLHASASCTGGVCGLSCDPGWQECDASPATGCETDATTKENCGTCGNHCTGQNIHGTVACVSGSCGMNCNPDYGDCDGKLNTGCEVHLTTSESHCGNCTTVCTVPPSTHSTPLCSAGQCGLNCTSGWGDCDLVFSNGCEFNVQSDTQNCGACGRACSLANASNSSCSFGTCYHVCVTGYSDCYQPPAPGPDDGCETSGDCI